MKSKLLFLLLLTAIFIKSQIWTIDPTYNIGSGANNYVLNVSIQPDQKIIATGIFTQFNGYDRKFIARLNTDGSIDEVFNPVLTNDQSLTKTAIQNDGKIIVSGSNQNNSGYIVRLNIDGSIDNTFTQPDMTFSSLPLDLLVLPDNKILVGGHLVSGGKNLKIYKLNPDGSLDNSFNNGNTGADNTVNSFLILPDNKILIGGYFSKYNGIDRKGIARLNPDGSLDETFNPGLGANNTIFDIELQNDGKILIGGFFTSYNNTPRKYLARINSDGSLDSNFNPETGPNDDVSYINAKFYNKILITGSFTKYNDVDKKYVAILNSDGSLQNISIDNSFDNPVNNCVTQNDDKLVCGGYFSNFNGQSSKGVVRLIPNPILSTNETNSPKIKIAPNPTSDYISISVEDSANANLYDINGKLISTFLLQAKENKVDISNHPSGIYIIEIISKAQKRSFKLIKK